MLESVLNLGTPFISLNCQKDPELHSLFIFSDICQSPDSTMLDIVEKAILLIKRGADIRVHNNCGDTALHIFLKSYIVRLTTLWRRSAYHRTWCELQQILEVFITAGADIYTPNTYGETPTILASKSGLTEIWINALEYCGVDSEAVIASSQDPNAEFVRQYSQVTFEEYCQRREAGLGRFEEIQDIDMGTDEERCGDEESDEDIDTNMDRHAEGDINQRREDRLRAVSEVEGGQNTYGQFELYMEDHDSIEFDIIEQLAEG